MSWIKRNKTNGLLQAEIDSLISSSSTCLVLEGASLAQSDFIGSEFKFSRLIGIGVKTEIVGGLGHSLSDLTSWLVQQQDLVLGYLSYDAKNLLEDLESNSTDSIGFPHFHFFVPETVIIERGDQQSVLSHLTEIIVPEPAKFNHIELGIPEKLISRLDYVRQVESLKNHIQQGDIYEVNYCVQHGFKNTFINPFRLYMELRSESPAPFSAYLKTEGKHLISASPERFMRKVGAKILSQPMKGTNRRLNENAEQMQALKQDDKEVAENVMITDLVRNDLSKTAKKGSVRVEELCGVYEFEHVNQMISSITSELRDDCNALDALLSAFPMGSMTGAPKISAMKLIESHEDFKRGMYSGSVGYLTPKLDFDFNVVIRSVLYNESQKVVTFPTGSAITINSDPDREYDECMLKAEAMRKVLLNHAK